jgi:undecaprenyl-diphosphatase
MEIWQAVVLGVVEGITEYLPVSSTGHLILASHLMALDTPAEKDAVDAFNIVVQGGAILAVAGLYWPRVVQMCRGLLGMDPVGLRLAMNLLIGFLPAAVLGVLLNKWIENHLFSPGPVLAAILLGGIFMIALDAWRGGRLGRLSQSERARRDAEIDDVTPRQALFIGFMQCVAMWPGTSRSMMSIAGGMLTGLKPRAAAEFAFLLGLPTLGGATAFKLYKNLAHADENGGNLFAKLGVMPVVVGLIVAAVSAAIAVKWLVGFLNGHGLSVFGWYRVGLFVVLAALAWMGGLSIGVG